MRVVTATQMSTLEKEAFEEGADADAFMQNAAAGIAAALSDYIRSVSIQKKVTLIAGKGNNSGDGYSAALILMGRGFQIEAYQLSPIEECSPLCQKYAKKFLENGGVLHSLTQIEDFDLPRDGILLDGIFGTGFKGEPPPLVCDVFEKINCAKVPIFSIDIPSGLEGDSGRVKKTAVKADFTIFLGLPKKGFFIRDGWNHVGHLVHVDFGLDPKYLEKEKPELDMLTLREASMLLPEVKRNRHKYQAGFVAAFSGSKGMMGASILSGAGALKSGAGIVKIVHLQDEFFDTASYPELIHKTFQYNQESKIDAYVEKASSFYIGPGIGTSDQMQQFVCNLLPQIKKPCVIDADALTILALNKIDPPKGSILTPHAGEAKRLLKFEGDDPEALIEACQNYANQKEVVLILKGGPTFIFCSGQTPVVNVTGDPGMATAGSGDVLTGILAALLSQENMDTLSCAKLGVFLHGKAGEFAAAKRTSYAMTATDILKSLHKSWIFLTSSFAN